VQVSGGISHRESSGLNSRCRPGGHPSHRLTASLGDANPRVPVPFAAASSGPAGSCRVSVVVAVAVIAVVVGAVIVVVMAAVVVAAVVVVEVVTARVVSTE
jgi:hypothetical protein